jgi:arylsulfatase
MVDRMDKGIGRMIGALREAGELENTLILFLSDNGASPENAARYGPGFDRPSQTRDGRKIVYPVNKEALPGPQTSFASIGPHWANVSNTPYRYAKEDSYEGGIRTPLIAFWPKGIRVPGGSMSGSTGHVMDFMATFVEVARAPYPAHYRGTPVKPLQGKSLVPAFRSQKATGHAALFNEHFGARYVRFEGWKLVGRRNEPWKLYRVAEDETERNDVASRYPEVVQKLEQMWQEWTKANAVVPK